MPEAELECADRLFAPLSLTGFSSEYWCRSPLHVHGAPDRFVGLYSLASFQSQLIGDMSPGKDRRPALHLKAVHNRAGGGAVFHPPANLAMGLFDAGMTLCASGLETSDARLAALVAAVRRWLHFTGKTEINAYYSPAGEGFGWHYDCQHVFILQIDGTKNWEFTSTPGIESPSLNMSWYHLNEPGRREAAAMLGMRVSLPSELEVRESILEPGDMLYLPPGVWHRASAGPHSFALTLTLYPLSFARVFQGVVTFLTLSNPDWRRDLHSGCSDPVTALTGEPQQSVELALDELRAKLNSMRPVDFVDLFLELHQDALMTRMVDA